MAGLFLNLNFVSGCEYEVYSCESWNDCSGTNPSCICPSSDPYCDNSCGQCSCSGNEDCDGYMCSNGKCTSQEINLCQGVSCPNYCGGTTTLYYNGYCSDGSCYYSSMTCPSGQTCQSGACVASTTCTNGQTQSCTINGCAGTQTCSSGQWGSCIKNDPCCGVTCPSGQTCQSGACVTSTACTNGNTQRCYTDDGCIGAQICIKNKWSTCLKDNFCCNIFNWNFENGMTGWEWSLDGDHKITSETSHYGSYSALIGFKDSENVKNGYSQIWTNVGLPLSGKVNASFWYNFYSYDTYPYDEFTGIIGNGSVGEKNQIIGRITDGFPDDSSQWDVLKSTGWKYFKTEIGKVEAGSDVFFHFGVANRYDTAYKSWAFIDDLTLTCVGCPICKSMCLSPTQKVIVYVSNTKTPAYAPVYEVKAVDLCNVEHKGLFSSDDLLGPTMIRYKDPIKFTGYLEPPYWYNISVIEGYTNSGYQTMRRVFLLVPIVSSESPIEIRAKLP